MMVAFKHSENPQIVSKFPFLLGTIELSVNSQDQESPHRMITDKSHQSHIAKCFYEYCKALSEIIGQLSYRTAKMSDSIFKSLVSGSQSSTVQRYYVTLLGEELDRLAWA